MDGKRLAAISSSLFIYRSFFVHIACDLWVGDNLQIELTCLALRGSILWHVSIVQVIGFGKN